MQRTEHAFAFCGIMSGTARCANTKRPLTRSLDSTEEGLAMQATPARYKSVRDPAHPLATPSGLILLHRKMLYDRIGPGWHPCHWCGEPVEWRIGKPASGALVADHLDHDTRNNSPENLVPSCNPCNGHRLHGETWEPWTPGTPTGRPDRFHARCRKGHLLTLGNVYIRPDTGRRRCLRCIQDSGQEKYLARTPEQCEADLARNRERVPCPVCGELKGRGSMKRHIRAVHPDDKQGAGNKGTDHCASLAEKAGIPVRRVMS